MDDLAKTKSVSIKSESTVASTEEEPSPFPCGYKPVAANAHHPPPSTESPHPVLCEFCHHPADSHPPQTPDSTVEKRLKEQVKEEKMEAVKEDKMEVKGDKMEEGKKEKEQPKEVKEVMKEAKDSSKDDEEMSSSPVSNTETDKKERGEKHKERRRERHREDKEKDKKEKAGKDESKSKDEKAKEKPELKPKGIDEEDSVQKKITEGPNEMESPAVATPSGDQKIPAIEEIKLKDSEAAKPNPMLETAKSPEVSRKISLESLDESTSSSSTDEDDEDSGVDAAEVDEETGEPPRRFIVLRRLSNTFPFAKDCLNILDVTDMKEYDGMTTEPPMVMVTVEGIVPAPLDRMPQALPAQASVEPL